MKESAVSNEEIIAAIISAGTFEAAAAACGVSTRTIRDRMKDQDFILEYEAAKMEIIRAAVAKVNSYTVEAIDTIAEIMRDKESSKPGTRLNAARAILSAAERLSDNLATDERKEQDHNGVWMWEL